MDIATEATTPPASQVLNTATTGTESPPAQATATTPPPALAPNTEAGGSGNWYDGFKNAEVKAFAETKNFKDPEMAIDSYRNLEKLMGAPKDRLLKLPEDPASAEWETIYQRLGKPEKADGYKVEIPAEHGASKEFIDFTKNMFHEANLTTAQAAKVMEKWNAFNGAELQKTNEASQAELARNHQELQSKWGNAFDQKLNMAKAGAKEFGVDAEKIDAMQKAIGYTKTMEFFQTIGSKLGEAQFHSGDSRGFGALSPETARLEIASLKSDPTFIKQYSSGDAQAKAKMSKLMADAYPGQMSI